MNLYKAKIKVPSHIGSFAETVHIVANSLESAAKVAPSNTKSLELVQGKLLFSISPEMVDKDARELIEDFLLGTKEGVSEVEWRNLQERAENWLENIKLK